MKHYFLVALLLFVLRTRVPAQTTDLAPETYDAYHILLRARYESGFVPDAEVFNVLAELRAIRAMAPEVAKVHEVGRFALGDLIVRIRSLLSPSRSEEQQKSLFRRMTSNPLSTGIQTLDELNMRFGVIEMVDHSGDGLNGFLIMHFRKPLNMESVANIYHKQLGAEIQVNYVLGNGNHIERFKKDGGPIQYAFSIGSGDCPAGCIHRVYFTFNLYPEAKGLRVERLNPSDRK